MPIRLVCFLAGLLAVSHLWSQSREAPMLVSTQWLSDHLNDPNLVVLHVGGEKDYAAGHIPGARRLSLADISGSGPDGLRLELPPLEKLRDALGQAGVANDSRIVVYPANESVPSATRVWFTLEYAGLGARASLLDGGLPLWKAEGRPLSTAAASVIPTQPRLAPRTDLTAGADWIRAHLHDPEVRLLDARTPEYHSGANPGQMPRAGRIPGAANVPFDSLLDAQLKFRPAGELRAMIPSGKELVAYCHIGQQATLLYFAARLLGEKVRLYDGSFQEWSRRSDLPVEASSEANGGAGAAKQQ
jgi:thiosulfate/3-mercaptopyruvate sulfurtransferase